MARARVNGRFVADGGPEGRNYPAENRQRHGQRAVSQTGLATLEAVVGGRAALLTALELAPASPDVVTLRALLADPGNATEAIGVLCQKAGLTLPHVWALFREATFTRAQVAALARVAEGAPAVAGDVMARAVEHEATCDVCFGRTKKRGKNVCVRCGGRGKVTVIPNLKRQVVALEMAGLVKRGGGVQVGVNVTQQTAMNVNFPTTFAKFQHASDRILYGDGRGAAPPAVVEAEPAK